MSLTRTVTWSTLSGGSRGPNSAARTMLVMRHTFATQLLRGGADPVLVADLLGHAGLDTLRTYTQPDDADRNPPASCRPAPRSQLKAVSARFFARTTATPRGWRVQLSTLSA